MGYIIGLVFVLILIPLLVMMLTRRTHAGGGGVESADHGVTPDRPAAEEPTPRAGPGVDSKIPPA